MKELKPNESIMLNGGTAATVQKELGRGGQGIVYEVKISGKLYALKWYTCKFKDKNAFRKNLEENIRAGAPSAAFLWPLFLTEEAHDTFGYVMELRPKEYTDFSAILNNKVKFKTNKNGTPMELTIKAALNIVSAFQLLHRKGLSYQDLNDGGFFINVENGDVLICDNDNVTPYGKKNPGGVGGKPGYMAPEIVTGALHPSMLTDYHSLAVILFKLFLRHDPLMGEQYVKSICITEEREVELYGRHPVFIFNPDDASNRPVPGVHPNPIKLWGIYPKFFQDAFIKSFAEGMKNPGKRLTEHEWQKILIRFRDMVVKCLVCGKDEVLLNHYKKGDTIKCSCGSSFSFPLFLKTANYTVPLFPGNELYACHTADDAADDYSTQSGVVIVNKNNPSLWGIKNVSPYTWTVTSSKGEVKTIEHGAVLPITAGLTVQFKGIAGKIE